MQKVLYSLFLFLFCNCHNETADTITLSCDELLFTWAGNTEKIVVEANNFWTVTSKIPLWVQVSSLKGNGGHESVEVKVQANESGISRTCEIVFSGFNEKKHLNIVQKAKEKLSFAGQKEYIVSALATKLQMKIERNIGYELAISEKDKNWIYQVNAEEVNDITSSALFNNTNTLGTHKDSKDFMGDVNILALNIAENKTKEKRCAAIVIYNEEYHLSDTISIIQEAGEDVLWHLDGEYKQLEQAVKGEGVNLVFMGDGFTKKDLSVNGRYEAIMKQAIDYFFSIEPYQTYRDYFNIYMVIAESEEEGVNTANDWRGKINNKFGTGFGEGTAIECNDELCFEYARKIKELKVDVPITIIMPLNSTKYAGTAYLYANGNSIALCPMSGELPPNDFEGVIHHEAGGHGFGFLCDEYVYYKTKMPENRKANLREWQKYGYQMNLDFTNDISSILWKDFIGIPKYNQVGAYEGGYEYQYGVWRSEHNSCMNNNIPYYNVQSRWSIVRRIMKLAGVDFSTQDFIEADCVTSWSSMTRGDVSEKILPPLGVPKWIK